MEKSKNDRLALHLEFTAGSNILLDCNAISECLSSGFDLNKLNKELRKTLIPFDGTIKPYAVNKSFDLNKVQFHRQLLTPHLV